MKGLLDRLMARQAKLMADLHPVPTRQGMGSASHRAKPTVGAEERAARLKAEDQALTSAIEPLARGALDEAAALLEPHMDRAQDTRTLTTMSRIRSQQGDFDEALRLLQSADALDPSDPKVAYFMGELLQSAGRYQEEIYYRRRAAFSRADAGAAAFVKLIGAIVRAAGPGKPPPTGEIRAALKGLGGTADLTPQLRFEVAQQLYRVRGMAPQALTWLEDALPCPADQRQVEPRWHTMASWCASAHTPMHVLGDAGDPGRRPWVAELRDALMHPGMRGTPILDDGRALVYGFEDHNLRKRLEEASPLLLDKRTRAVLRLPRETLTIDEPALYIGGVGDDALDLLQHCGSLAVVEALGLCTDMPLVVNEPVAPRLRQLLSLLGLDRRRWITVASDRAVLFKHLWLPGRLLMRGRWVDPLLPQWYRRRLVDAAPALRGGPGRKLFVADASARGRVADEDDLKRALAPLGFERIDPAGLGLRDVMEAFAAARELVLPYGGAMANLAFSAPGTRVVVLGDKRTVETAQALDYVLLGKAAQHDVRIVSGHPVRAGAADAPTGIELQFASDDVLAALSRTDSAA
jgi:tetratricopeptide (TPR) repeat protein